MLTIGPHGAVAPLVTFGRKLQAAGHEVKLGTNANYENLVTRNGLAFAAIAPDATRMVNAKTTDQQFRAANHPIKYYLALRAEAREISAGAMRVLDRCVEVSHGAEVLLYHGHLFAADAIAAHLKIPGIQAYNTPVTPTREFPSYIALRPWAGPSTYNRITHTIRDLVTWLPYRPLINRWRRSSLGLPPLPLDGPYRDLDRRRVPLLYSTSPTILPKPADWGDWIHLAGPWLADDDPAWVPPPELTRFLEAGPPPVSIGFGSMKFGDPKRLTRIVVEALQQARLRAVLLTGWNALDAEGLPDTIYACSQIPHRWLFSRVAAAVHGGGIGTLTASLRAGLPTLAVPFGGDSTLWGWRCAQIGAGPAPIPIRKLTSENLASALRALTTDASYRYRAEQAGESIRAEEEADYSIDVFQTALRQASTGTQSSS